jgi:predicted NAD-dependent protein-ADP-ribosyltransferase YbiA (DUF1768 family)
MTITHFVGPYYRFLANDAPYTIFYNGCLWRHVEQAYRETKVHNQEERLAVMRSLIAVKFDPILRPNLSTRLLRTGSLTLINGNVIHDTFWGFCTCTAHGYGENHLGKLLMQRRVELHSMF